MTPGTYHLNIYRGDTYRYRFALWDDSFRSAPTDLTDATVKAEIRSAAGGTIISEMPLTITLPNIVDGTIDSDMSKAMTAGVWDLQVSFAGTPPDVKTVLAGNVVLTPDVTDSGA